MKRTTFIFLLLVFISMLGCYKKYPEDDFISFRSPENRLANNFEYKMWTFKKCIFNGVDVTNIFTQSASFYPKMGFINRASAGGDENSKALIEKDNISESCGHWSIGEMRKNGTKDKSILYLSCSIMKAPFDSIFNIPGATRYTILELTNKQLKIEQKVNGNNIIFDYEH